MNLFEGVYKKNEDNILNMIDMLKRINKSDFEGFSINDKEIKKAYVGASLWARKNFVTVIIEKKDYKLFFRFLIEENDFNLSKIKLENKNNFSILSLTEFSTKLELVGKNNVYNFYEFRDGQINFTQGSFDKNYCFNDFPQKEKAEISKLSNFLFFCINNDFIKNNYLNDIYINNIILKNKTPKDITESFKLLFDIEVNDYSDFLKFDINEKFNILKKENTLMSKIKKKFKL